MMSSPSTLWRSSAGMPIRMHKRFSAVRRSIFDCGMAAAACPRRFNSKGIVLKPPFSLGPLQHQFQNGHVLPQIASSSWSVRTCT